MTQIVNNDKTTYILTQYGLSRIAEILADHNKTILITKVKVGDANGEYYEPQQMADSLINPIPNGEFPIVSKTMLEDQLTICFRFIIPETFGNCDIREIGLYETIGDTDYLFALGTQQPIVKPATSTDTFMSVDYYIFLKPQNLADYYDRIILDPETQVATQEDLEDFMSTILFSQTNLMDQIAHNSCTIGLNRAAQLNELIDQSRVDTSESTAYLNYYQVINTLGVDNVLAYWVFDYPRQNKSLLAVSDLGPLNTNLSTSENINTLPQRYLGVSSALDFESPNYYFLTLDQTPSLITPDGTSDIDFTIIYCLQSLGSGDKTILARSNYNLNSNIFEIKELNNKSIFVRLFTSASSYITYTTSANTIPEEQHSVILEYTSSTHDMKCFINGLPVDVHKVTTGSYSHMNNTPANLYAYQVTPTITVYSDSSSNPTTLYDLNGATNANPLFTIEGSSVLYNGQPCEVSTTPISAPTLFAYHKNLEYIYTKDTVITPNTILYTSNRQVYGGNAFTTIDGAILYNGMTTERDPQSDLPSFNMYPWVYTEDTKYIWANDTTNPSVLYRSDGSVYVGNDWQIVGSSIYYRSTLATRDTSLDKDIPLVPAGSYITTSEGNKTEFCNSSVALLSILKGTIPENELRPLSLLFTTAIGENSCVILS